jgi:hypothetical protein
LREVVFGGMRNSAEESLRGEGCPLRKNRCRRPRNGLHGESHGPLDTLGKVVSDYHFPLEVMSGVWSASTWRPLASHPRMTTVTHLTSPHHTHSSTLLLTSYPDTSTAAVTQIGAFCGDPNKGFASYVYTDRKIPLQVCPCSSQLVQSAIIQESLVPPSNLPFTSVLPTIGQVTRVTGITASTLRGSPSLPEDCSWGGHTIYRIGAGRRPWVGLLLEFQ